MAWWKLGGRARPRNETDSAATGEADPQGLLSEQVTFRAPARIVLLPSGRSLEARFAALSEHEVLFDLPSPRGGSRIPVLTPCCVHFHHRRRTLLFLSQVHRADVGATEERPRQLGLRVPSGIVGEDLRSAPRLAPRGAGLRTRIVGGVAEGEEALALNLSGSGALLEMSGDKVPPPGEKLQIELQLGDDRALLGAVVRRQEGARIGVLFPESLQRGAVRPPLPLAGLLEKLGPALPTASPSPIPSAASSH